MLRLPLASDGKTVDMILGLTMYFDDDHKPVVRFCRFGNSSAEFPSPWAR